ncbi:hypothetical protein PMIN04_006738 [Paraphaeosphaeria minitans]|uniref:Uncharacterized protein n=1 Tax=Paraphaeosphaeria minitans TaxID=565426 RepID=A0A9P6GTS7_9PLEO|nr:hypothetical protein PMIN01_00657 [Paraphaeosphaeria minitans]
MSQLNAQFVKQGFWVNVLKGPVLGQTITTTTSTGNLVVAFMAVLTTLGTSHLWNLFVFAYHQMRVNGRHRDGLKRQQQALMRTLPAPSTLLADWLKLWWVWRKRVSGALQRSIFLVLVAILFAAIMVVVGIFSSYLVDGTNIIVLVQSPYCGSIDYEGVDTTDNKTAYANWAAWQNFYGDKIAEIAAPYARDCYVDRTALPERCRIFTHPKIPLHQTRTSCPFDDSICKKVAQPGFVSDTGLIDFGDHFGLNLVARDKIKFRRTATCAVLDLEGRYDMIDNSNSTEAYAEKFLGRDIYAEEQYRRYYLGKTVAANFTKGANYMPVDTQRYAETSPGFHYNSPFWSDFGSSFDPILELESNDSDLVIVFVALHGTRFLEPVDDLLYSAHKPFNQMMTDNSTRKTYTADEPLSAFACQNRYQFCFAQDGKNETCTNLLGLPSTKSAAEFPGANEAQMALLRLIVQLLYWNDAQGAMNHLTPASINSGFNAPLPSDQWLQDMIMLEQNIRAQLQIALSTYAAGGSTLDSKPTTPLRHNATQAEKNLCGIQLMQSPGGFVNINVFALAFVVTFCIVVTALDLILLKFLVFWHRFRGILAPRIDAWVQDGTFQLQRRAYEMQGEGTWERLDKEVPVTTYDTELSTLPLESRPFCDCTSVLPMGVKPLSTTTTMVSQPACREKKSPDLTLSEFEFGNADSCPTPKPAPSHSEKVAAE